MSLLLVALLSLPAAAAPPRLELHLAEAEAQAMVRSPLLAAALENAKAGWDRSDSQWAALIPRLTFDGS